MKVLGLFNFSKSLKSQKLYANLIYIQHTQTNRRKWVHFQAISSFLGCSCGWNHHHKVKMHIFKFFEVLAMQIFCLPSILCEKIPRKKLKLYGYKIVLTKFTLANINCEKSSKFSQNSTLLVRFYCLCSHDVYLESEKKILIKNII